MKKVNLAELKKKGLIVPVPIDKLQINELLAISERDLRIAEELLPKNFDVSLNLSYNSMLQAARAFMFSYGYRPDSEFHHKATIWFIGAVLDVKNRVLVEALDRVRSKRVTATYEQAGAISEFEAKYALKTAKDLLGLLKNKIKERVK